MTWSSRPPREIVARWAQLPVAQAEPEVGSAERDEVVARLALGIAKASAARKAARKRLLLGVSTFAAAAAVVLGVGAFRYRSAVDAAAFGHVRAVDGAVSVKRAGEANATRLSAASAELEPGDEVVTSLGAHTQLDLSSGVRLSLGEASRLQLPNEPARAASPSPTREQVRLDAGKVQINVPPLKSGRSFAVKTPDTEVTVHGTAFSVEVAPATSDSAGRGTTHVAVSEGVVSVRSAGQELFLRAGSAWTSGAAPPSELVPPAKAPATREDGATSEPVRNGPGAPSASSPASSLAEQNQLLERAMSASRSGQDAVAVKALRELLRRYPSTRLAQEARVQLFRAFSRSGDRANAGREARRYLQSYPDGFAREEARKLALDGR